MRAFLASAAKEHKGGVIFLGEKLEGGGIVERMDIVLLSELLG